MSTIDGAPTAQTPVATTPVFPQSAPLGPRHKPSRFAQDYIDELARAKPTSPLGPYPTAAYHNDAQDPSGAKNAPVTDAQLDVLDRALPRADAGVAWQSSVFQAMHPSPEPEQAQSLRLLTEYTASLGYLAAAGKAHDQARIDVLGQTAARQANDLGIPENTHQAFARKALNGA